MKLEEILANMIEIAENFGAESAEIETKYHGYDIVIRVRSK